ncbi:type VI secretion system baseplate subunit TssF [Myxococcaceae bacterium GXIMD 01537]
MELDDTLYKAFLVELEALEKFRMGYTALHPAVPLGRDDQDVRRLTEALALFTARTRLAGQRAISRSTLRLFQQHFPYVLSPMPAMGMLHAMQASRFVDPLDLPRGTEVRLTPGAGTSATGHLTFRTLAPLRLLPLKLDQVNILKRKLEGFRLLLTFETSFPRNDEVGTLRLYVNHLNEFLSSLAVHYHLKENLRAASILFEERITEETVGAPCTLRFGALPTASTEREPFEHPLQRIRGFFHHPQQELFIEARVPAMPRNWTRFTLCLDVGPRWPVELLLTPDTFVLNAVPMHNLQRAMSNPVEHDGTKERHAILHPDPTAGFRVHSVLGAYRLDGNGLIPLRPGAIAGGPDTYEVEHEGRGVARRTSLSLELPGAFLKPVRVAVEACWHQPLPPQLDASGYSTGLPGRFIEGIKWGFVGSLSTGQENRLEYSQQGMLQLLSIRNQRFLGLEDLHFLLEVLGMREERYFRPVAERLSDVEVRSKPFAKSTTGFKYIYRITFSELDPLLLPTVDLFSARLLELLRDWSTEDVVELEVNIPNLETELNFHHREVDR